MVKGTRKHSVTKEMVIEDVKRLYKAIEEEGKSYPSLRLAFSDKSYPCVTKKYVKKFFGSCIEMSKELDLPIKTTSTKMYRCAHCGKEVIKMKTVDQTIEYFGEEYTYEIYENGKMIEEGYGWEMGFWFGYSVTTVKIEDWGDENTQIIKLYIRK